MNNHLTTSPVRHRNRRRRGSALALIVVVSVIITGLVLTIAWAAGVQSQIAGAQAKLDSAYYAAEAGAQRALWQFKHDNSYRAAAGAPLTGNITMNNIVYAYTTTCVDAPANPWGALARWKLDETSGTTAAAAVGASAGTTNGGASWVAGRWNNGIQLNGTTGYVDCGTAAALNLTSAMAIAAWVNLTSASGTQVIAGNQSGSYGGYKLTIYNSKVEFEVRNSSNTIVSNRASTGGTALTTGSWYHLAGVYSPSAGTIKTYVNGVLDRTVSGVAANALTSTSTHLYLGREPASSTSFLNGILDDVQIFSRALQDSEIKSLDNGGQVLIASTATGNGASATVSFLAASAVIPITAVPAYSMGGATLDLKNLDVIGDVQAAGNISASTGHSSITGNLTYAGTFDGSHLSVTGTTTHAAVTVPTVNYAALQTAAGTNTLNGAQNNHTFDFTAISGTNKVIYVNGAVTNPTFIGAGTLYATGNISTGNFGTAANPVNLVTPGNITFTANNMTVYGSIYAGGTWTRNKVNMTGMAVAALDGSGGTSTLTVAATAPWFDPRTGGGGGGGGSGSGITTGLFAEPLP